VPGLPAHGELGELQALATVTVTQAARDDVLASQRMRRYGYPMT